MWFTLLVHLVVLHLHVTTIVSQNYPFQNYNLSWDVRTWDLIHRLSPDELVQQLSKGGAGEFGGPAPAISRLGVQPYQWNTECLHGAAEAGLATSFPQSINLAATFDTDLVRTVAGRIAVEVRAKHNYFMQNKQYQDHTGLSCFAPVINIMRHPFWGRNQETYGEDPFLSGILSAAYVTGLQGDKDARYIMTNAGCKHFAAHDGPENYPTSRFSFDAKVSDADLDLTFLPQFKKCVAAGSYSIMCSYNRINGVPACANYELLTKKLRHEWGFQGYVVTDEGALEFAIVFHEYFKNNLEAAIGAFKSGVNLELSPLMSAEKLIVFESLKTAYENSNISLAELQQAAYPLFYTRMRLGEFDPPSMIPFSHLGMKDVQTEEARQISFLAATSSIVLLKNVDNFLPIKKLHQRIGLSGPFSANMSLMYGSYSADRSPKYEIDIIQGLNERHFLVKYANYCTDGVFCNEQNISVLNQLVQDSEILIFALGTSTLLETEDNDRRSLELPEGQYELVDNSLRIMRQLGKNIPVIILIFSGSPVDLDFYVNNPEITSLLWCGYPGQTVGKAIVSVLLGDTVPYAALPFTWYSVFSHLPNITDYNMVYQTYRYRQNEFATPPLFPFAYGLSFCKIKFLNLTLPEVIKSQEELILKISLTNIGSVPCPYVIKVYLSLVDSLLSNEFNPLISLVAVSKLPLLGVGEEVTQTVTVMPDELLLWNSKQHRLDFLPGSYRITVGDYFDKTCKYCNLKSLFRMQ